MTCAGHLSDLRERCAARPAAAAEAVAGFLSVLGICTISFGAEPACASQRETAFQVIRQIS